MFVFYPLITVAGIREEMFLIVKLTSFADER